MHVEVPVEGEGAELALRVTMTGIAAFHVHGGWGYGRWDCTPEGDEPAASLSCTLAVAGTTDDFAIDVVPTVPGEAWLSFDLTPEGALDPEPDNNQAAVRVGELSPESPRRRG
ncbi:hypothetical protein NOCA2330001 [metagenome]|uniref:Uncharacterized protein n=1 Tax=metagenome TaxID=256318 RepID=A0A2P2C2M9_9ZZZZ